MSSVSRKILVSGRVQGVGFRWSTQQKAQALQLSGYAKNLMDGRVEVLACGSEKAVSNLIAWLRHGPSTARVDGLVINDVSEVNYSNDFTTT
ncbi:Acylphosphatase [invertebrate metagenome]|uniref:Acylphosphatase n=1 Tax=invertebrate metagenome TaxID=1711999 RepID=A0A2H9TBT3_9ZZZZ